MKYAFDIYTICIGCIALRFIFTDTLPYMVSCLLLGIGMGVYSGLHK